MMRNLWGILYIIGGLANQSHWDKPWLSQNVLKVFLLPTASLNLFKGFDGPPSSVCRLDPSCPTCDHSCALQWWFCSHVIPGTPKSFDVASALSEWDTHSLAPCEVSHDCYGIAAHHSHIAYIGLVDHMTLHLTAYICIHIRLGFSNGCSLPCLNY